MIEICALGGKIKKNTIQGFYEKILGIEFVTLALVYG